MYTIDIAFFLRSEVIMNFFYPCTDLINRIERGKIELLEIELLL